MDGLWEIQKMVNENTDMQIKMMISQLGQLIQIVKEQEEEIEQITARLDELEKLVQK